MVRARLGSVLSSSTIRSRCAWYVDGSTSEPKAKLIWNATALVPCGAGTGREAGLTPGCFGAAIAVAAVGAALGDLAACTGAGFGADGDAAARAGAALAGAGAGFDVSRGAISILRDKPGPWSGIRIARNASSGGGSSK